MSLSPVSRLPLQDGSILYTARTFFHRLSLKVDSFIRRIFHALCSCFSKTYTKTPSDKFPTIPLLKTNVDVIADTKRTIERLETTYKDKGLDAHKLLGDRKVLLIIVDPQNDFNKNTVGKNGEAVGKDGGLGLEKGRHCNAVANRVAAYVRSLGGDTVATGDYHLEDHISFVTQHPGKKVFDKYPTGKGSAQETIWPVHCVQGTDGANFSSEIERDNVIFTVAKGTNKKEEAYSAIESVLGNKSSRLFDLIKQGKYTDIWIGGNAFDVCAKSTAIDIANKVKGSSAIKRIHFLSRMSAPVTLEGKQASEEAIRKAGINIID